MSSVRSFCRDGDEQHSATARHVNIAIIGGGYSGLAAAIRFDQAGHDDFLVFERGSDVGGTWRDNTYRGGMRPAINHRSPSRSWAIGGRNGAARDSRGGTGTWIPASGCNDASTAAAVHDALCGSTAITTRSLPDWIVIDTYANLF